MKHVPYAMLLCNNISSQATLNKYPIKPVTKYFPRRHIYYQLLFRQKHQKCNINSSLVLKHVTIKLLLNNALVLSYPEVARGGGGLETWGNVGDYGDFMGTLQQMGVLCPLRRE